MSLNWGGNVVQMPRRDPELSELAEMFPVPRITEDPDFRPRVSNGLLNVAIVALCVALGIAVCVWRFSR